jgi:hypothetical protein
MKITTLFFSLVAAGLCSAAFAESPFDGTWQLNAAKSHLAGDTMTFEDAGSGSLKYTDSGQSYTFKADGSAFTTPMGTERTFAKNSDGTYTSTNKRNGMLLSTSTWKQSAEGNTIVIESKGTKPNGDTFDNVTTYVRTSAGTGLVGGWKSTVVKLSSPNALTLQTDGNEVTLAISAIKATCHAKWDGKDYPASGPTVGDGLTLAVTKTGANSFKLVQKFKSKVLVTVRYHVAPDGKTMAAHGVNGEGKEPFSEIWDKQS